MKKQLPGVLTPVIDRTRCEGGYHLECKENGMPCVAPCSGSILEIRRLSASDKKGLSLSEKFRILVHKNRQASVVKPLACDGCAECVKACPVHAIKLKRSGQGVREPAASISKIIPEKA